MVELLSKQNPPRQKKMQEIQNLIYMIVYYIVNKWRQVLFGCIMLHLFSR